MPMRFCACLLLAMAAGTVHAGCDRERAYNRMFALNQFGMKLQAELPDPLKDPAGYQARFETVQAFGSELAGGGLLLAENRFDEACALYDRIAVKFGVDEAAQGVRPLSEYEKPAPQGSCDLTAAALRSAWLTEAFQKYAEARALDREAWQKFGDETAPIGLAMQQDPARACAMIDEVAARYGLQR